MLEITNLQKSYGTHAVLRGVDLQVARGHIVSLLGKNGAGKTTLVSIVAGLQRADGGTIKVDGMEATGRTSAIRQCMGVAPQELGIYPTLTVADNLRFFGQLHGLVGQALQKRIRHVAESLSLDPLLSQTAGTLSGGQKRRLHTASALLHQPKLVFLDEPTVGADVQTRAEIVKAVQELASQGTTVVYSTHYLPEVEALGGEVAILDGGRIVVRDSVEALISTYGTPVVEITFSQEAPNWILQQGRMDRQGHSLRVTAPNPDAVIAEILQQSTQQLAGLRTIEVIRPSLENAYLAITGQHYSKEKQTGE